MVRALALLGTAAVLAGVDLMHKSAVGPQNLHPRSAVYVIVVLVLTSGWVLAILAARSTALALGGGVTTAGTLGNIVSLAFWEGVPNPILLESIAFNFADLYVIAGLVLVAAGILVMVARDPAQLRMPVTLRR